MLFDLINTIKNTSDIEVTPQEARVLSLWRYGDSSKETAIVLNIGCSTIYWHRENIKNKFRVNTFSELKKFIREKGLTKDLINVAEKIIDQK